MVLVLAQRKRRALASRRRVVLLASGLALLFAAAPVHAASPGQLDLDEGTRLYQEERYAEARAAFERAIDLDPGLLKAWENRGWAELRLGEHTLAAATFETVLKIVPRHTALLNALASIRAVQQRWADAAALLQSSLRVDPTQPFLHLRLAHAYEQQGESAAALDQLQRAVATAPGVALPRLRLAQLHARLGRPDTAVAGLRAAASAHPELAEQLDSAAVRIRLQQGDTAYREQRYAEAVRAYRHARELQPRHPRAALNLAFALRAAGRDREAGAAFREAIQLQPRAAQPRVHLGDVLRSSGDPEGAREAYERAWDLASTLKAPIAARLLELACGQDRTADARRWSRELLQLSSPRSGGLTRLANQLRRCGDLDWGIELLRSAQQTRPAEPEGQEALSRLYVARAARLRTEDRLPAAAADLARAVELAPDSSSALRALGWVHWAQQDWGGAQAAWSQYRDRHPTSREPHALLALVHLRRGDPQAAIDAARRSLAIDPEQPSVSLRLVRAYLAAGEPSAARALAAELARRYPTQLDIQTCWADLLAQDESWPAAELQWRSVLDLGSTLARARVLWVRSMYEQGKYEEALDAAASFARSEPDNPNLLQLLAEDARIRQQRPEARHWYERLVRAAPLRLDPWLQLARLEREAGEFDASQRTLERARLHHPDRLELALASADLLRETAPALSRARFRQLAAEHPGNREAFIGALAAALQERDLAAARTLLQSSRASFLAPHKLTLQQAQIEIRAGELTRAQELLDSLTTPRAASVDVPILLYHGLADHPRSPSTSAAAFAAQMRALREHGYTAITLHELERMRRGAVPFPSKPVAITFDDARIDSFTRADPVLAELGLRATMLVPTARAAQKRPGVADWEQIRAMARTGRWDIQSHGHAAHDPLATAPGQQGGFLVNRAWLEAQGRHESQEEYRERLRTDHARSREAIEAELPGQRVIAYAFPFSEAGQEGSGNEPDATQINEELVKSEYVFALIQDSDGYNRIQIDPAAGPTLLRRLSVPRDWDGPMLVRHLAEHSPTASATRDLASLLLWTGRPERAAALWLPLAQTDSLLQRQADYFTGALLTSRGLYQSARAPLERWAEEQPALNAQASSLLNRLTWENRIRAEPLVSHWQDSLDQARTWTGVGLHLGSWLAVPPMQIRLGQLRFTGPDAAPLSGQELDSTVRFTLGPSWSITTRGRQRWLNSASDSLSAWAEARYRDDRWDVALELSDEDVDTVRALRAGVQQRGLSTRWSWQPSPRLAIQGSAAKNWYDDGNQRWSTQLRILMRPSPLSRLQVGIAVEASDTRFLSSDYYTPDSLRAARLLTRYQFATAAGSSLDSELSLGPSWDRLIGSRFIAQARLRGVYAWNSKLRSGIELRHSTAPGYRSWEATTNLWYGF